jgi:UrcA family protein
MRHFARNLILPALCSALLGVPAFAHAQEIEEVVVTGHLGPDNQPETLRYKVGYRDLDLRKKSGRDELQRRVEVTADYLCAKIGHDVVGCKQNAIADALPKVQAVEDAAIASKTAWKAGPKWIPPG